MKYYEKNGQEIGVHDTFVYCSEIYKLWKGGACLLEERYYSSPKLIKLSKKDKTKKFKDYILRRCWDLILAPEEYLLKNKFKLIKDES